MERKVSPDLLRLKLTESLNAQVPSRTARDIRVPALVGKAIAVIGVRRGGKTSFLQRRMADRMAQGSPREAQLLLSLEDERLVGMSAADLSWLLDEYARQFPGLGEKAAVSLYLDEVQLVSGWETLVRRLMDTGGFEIFISGSSAKLLSREVATSLRGRALEVLVHPFSFREALRFVGAEPDTAWEFINPNDRLTIEAALRRYLKQGGFPEAQHTDRRDRIALLKSYVDVMVLRDIIERHNVTNTQALRWLQRHLMSTPGGSFSVNKLYNSLRSQGVPVSKDILYEYLDHLQDAFLLRIVSMHSTSERQRMTNPRKAYPVDSGLIEIYQTAGREHTGRALESAVMLELERRGYTVEWFRTEDGYEVDFFAQRTGDPPLLIQVSLETIAEETWQREVRSLQEAENQHPEARAMLITLDPYPPTHALPDTLAWYSAAQWFLETE